MRAHLWSLGTRDQEGMVLPIRKWLEVSSDLKP